jgi:hypothetical protein
VTILATYASALTFTVKGQKGPQIALANPHDAIDAVHGQITVRDPAPNRTR